MSDISLAKPSRRLFLETAAFGIGALAGFNLRFRTIARAVLVPVYGH